MLRYLLDGQRPKKGYFPPRFSTKRRAIRSGQNGGIFLVKGWENDGDERIAHKYSGIVGVPPSRPTCHQKGESLCLLLRHGTVTAPITCSRARESTSGYPKWSNGGIFLVKWGEVMVTNGLHVNTVKLWGYPPPPPNLLSKGGTLMPPPTPQHRHSPNNVIQSKRGCAFSASGLQASCQHARMEFEAGWGTRAHLFRGSAGLKLEGVYPHFTIAL